MLTINDFYSLGCDSVIKDNNNNLVISESLNNEVLMFLNNIKDSELIELDKVYYDIISKALATCDNQLMGSAFCLHNKVIIEMARRYIIDHKGLYP